MYTISKSPHHLNQLKNTMSENKFSDYNETGTIKLTTYYQSGKAVTTPINYHKVGDKLYGSTPQKSWKVKRLRKNPQAKVAPCNMFLKTIGDTIDVSVRIMDENEAEKGKEMVAAIYKKFMVRLMSIGNKAPRFYLEIS